MIEIKIEAANGADARQQMLDLLGINGQLTATVKGSDLVAAQPLAELAKTGIEAQNSTVEETKPTEEAPKKKRRTQAEINAEREALEAASKAGEEQPAGEEAAGTDNEPDTSQEPAGPVAVTAEDLTKKAVELGRAGKRDAVLKTLEEQFGGATIAKKDGKPQLAPEQYQAVMDAFNAIG